MKRQQNNDLINLWNREAVRERRPLLIAHRGGVVSQGIPENSLGAIRLAATQGFDMVELDVTKPKDDERVLFHDWTGSLRMNCGIDARLVDHTARELTAICYRASEEPIATLEQALAQCRELRLGVMLDIKVRPPSMLTGAFVRRIGSLLTEQGLNTAAVTISTAPIVREVLAGQLLFPVTADDYQAVLRGKSRQLQGQFWFDLPEEITDEAIPALQAAGAYVLPAINTFRYPAHGHAALAQDDIERLKTAGVDGFQIDSTYRSYFSHGND